MSSPARIKRALIVCDMQADALPSLFATTTPTTSNNDATSPKVDPAARREAFLDGVRSAVLASISCPLAVDNALIIFLGLRFPSRYEGLHPEHSLYGSLRRLNEKVGDGSCHWFMEGHAGSDIDGDLTELVAKSSANHLVLWRTGHLPPTELSSHLRDNGITDATLVGAKASQCLQATVQFVADQCPGIDLSVICEAVADDSPERLEAVVLHLLPLYARVASLEEYVEATCGSERFAASLAKDLVGRQTERRVRYISNCRRGGHFALYAHHLMHRKTAASEETSWVEYPTAKWYEDVMRTGREYRCPLGKRVVAFCDEPQFSETSMFIKGRECLDDKAKLVRFAQQYLPETYVVKGGMSKWESAPTDMEGRDGPWFVKETNKNGGRAIQMCCTASECIALANKPEETYVIQRHIPNPHLTKDGKKWHLKIYSLLIGESSEGGATSWTLRCHNEGYLCIASSEWSAENLSPDAQMSIMRTKRFRIGQAVEELDIDVGANAGLFQRCWDIVASVVERAIDAKGLESRPGQRQFEIFSADFMFDPTLEKVFLIEFNFSPVLFDPFANQELTTPGLLKYHASFQCHGEKAEVNDHHMIKDACTLVFHPKEASKEAGVGGWIIVKPMEA